MPLELAVTSRDRYSFAESGSGASASATTAINNFARAGLIASASRSSIVPDGRDGRRGFRSEPRDALFPSGRPLTHTTSQFHVACPRSLENARHRYGRLLHHRCQKASAKTPWCRDWRRYLKEAERGARALGIRPVKAKPAKTDPSPAREAIIGSVGQGGTRAPGGNRVRHRARRVFLRLHFEDR
jgi:hypothetical protein